MCTPHQIVLRQTNQEELGGGGGTGWIDVAQDRNRWRVLMNVVMNLRVPLNVAKLTNSGPVSFSERTPFCEVCYS
jgi:hypothetical protein